MIEVLDERLAELVAVDAELELLASGFDFVEGPVWDGPGGYLLFTDVAESVIRRWDPAGGASEWRRPSHKANGMTRDLAGRLVTCQHVTSSVTRTEHDGSSTDLATHWQGHELNSPNDVCVSRSGAVYFTDPADGRTSERWGLVRPRQIDHQGVYLRQPGGEVVLLTDELAFPNGICLSPDERTLYVNDTAAMRVHAFDVRADGTVADGRVFLEQPGTGEMWDGVPDGMRCDERGNLWATGPHGIWIASAEGVLLGRIRIEQFTSNLAWGGPDWGDLYLTSSDRLYRLRTLTRSARVPHVVNGDLQRLADGLRARLDAGRVTIRVDDDVELEFPVKAEAVAHGLGRIAGDRLTGVRASETFQWVDRERRALVQDDIARSPIAPARALLERYGARSQILAPVRADDRTIALLSVHEGRTTRRWTPSEVELTERAACEVASLLDRPG